MTFAIVFVLAVTAIFSDTSVGRRLRDSLTRFRLLRPARGHLMAAMLIIVFTATLVALLKSDALALAARAAPEGIAWLAAFDVASWLDIVALAALTALALRLRVVWAFVRSAGSRCAVTVRAIRNRRTNRTHRRPRPSSRTSDDDGERWGDALFA